MIRTVILGVGWAGTRHVEAIRELDGELCVHGLADSDADFLEAKAAELGVSRTYACVGDVLADPEVDAVSICLPHALG